MRKYHSAQRKKAIVELVKKSPGIGFLEIKKISEYGNGVISNHLDALEEDGEIRIKRERRKIWIFHSRLNSKDDVIRIHLRKETCLKILRFLSKNKKANFAQIKQITGKSPSTTSLTLTKLIEKGIVKRIYIKKNTLFVAQYSLGKPRKTNKILNSFNPSHVDTLKDRFADTFSYF